MHTYFLLFILLFFLIVPKVFSQNPTRLLQERQELLDQLEEAESQSSSILGKKSKKDLRNTTEILKDIIDKDDEIIRVLRREISKKETSIQTVATPDQEQQIIELENQLAQMQNQANQRNIKTAELEQQIDIVKDRMFKYQSTILVTIFIIFLLTVYISRLRKKTKVRNPA